MKIVLSILVSFMATAAIAAPSQQQIDQAGLEILLSSSARLATLEGRTVAQILAQSMVTSSDTHNKISNKCLADKNDGDFKCKLTITNADDRTEGRTESSTQIQYILEKSNNGLPSKDLFYLSVEVMEAG